MTAKELLELADQRGIDLCSEEGKRWAESLKTICEAEKASAETCEIRRSKWKTVAETAEPVLKVGLGVVSIILGRQYAKQTLGECLAVENTGKLSSGCDKIVSKAFADTSKAIDSLRQ